jgi:hypothetical protein
MAQQATLSIYNYSAGAVKQEAPKNPPLVQVPPNLTLESKPVTKQSVSSVSKPPPKQSLEAQVSQLTQDKQLLQSAIKRATF